MRRYARVYLARVPLEFGCCLFAFEMIIQSYRNKNCNHCQQSYDEYHDEVFLLFIQSPISYSAPDTIEAALGLSAWGGDRWAGKDAVSGSNELYPSGLLVEFRHLPAIVEPCRAMALDPGLDIGPPVF